MLLKADGEMATRYVKYVDDIRVAGRGWEAAGRGCRRLKSRMNYHGNQASDEKYRPPSLRSGAWKGCILHTDTPFP